MKVQLSDDSGWSVSSDSSTASWSDANKLNSDKGQTSTGWARSSCKTVCLNFGAVGIERNFYC